MSDRHSCPATATRPNTQGVRVLLLCLILVIALGCRPTSTVNYDVPRPDTAADVIGPTDVFEVRVHLEEELSGEFRVDGDGTIGYPLLGTLKVDGLSPAGVSGVIRDGLADGYLLDPQVTVLLKEQNSRKVSMLGEVTRPGRYAYRDGMTLVEAIAEAGGTTVSAVLVAVILTRHVKGEEYSVELPYRDITEGRAPDFSLAPGDIVLVPTSPVK
jgi:protein involved in polysaccharide export with SLBB domain